MMLERDEIARRVKELAVDISYRREDLFTGMSAKTEALESERVRLYNTPEIIPGERAARLSEIDNELREIDALRRRIYSFATSMIDALPGKSLDDLRSFDVAGAPWPT